MFFINLFSTCFELFSFVLVASRVLSVVMANLCMTIITKRDAVIDVIASSTTNVRYLNV